MRKDVTLGRMAASCVERGGGRRREAGEAGGAGGGVLLLSSRPCLFGIPKEVMEKDEE